MEHDENYHLSQLSKQYANLKDHIKAQDEQLASYREILAAHNELSRHGQNADYYAWMPFEDNDIKSLVLTCPVLIPAGWLLQLLDEARKEGAQEAQDEIGRLQQSVDEQKQLIASQSSTIQEQNDTMLRLKIAFASSYARREYGKVDAETMAHALPMVDEIIRGTSDSL